ncbi:hypothetical protein [Kitasatospora sp. NBC_00458]|uniref:hypothetical protein n=1 Tax=Kitasatospora sp. NBC_00458 TaxID=2903568 RepID=UPI002E18F30A
MTPVLEPELAAIASFARAERPKPPATDDGNPWETGRCWLYYGRDLVAVLWIGPVTVASVSAPMFACAPCIARLNGLAWEHLSNDTSAVETDPEPEVATDQPPAPATADNRTPPVAAGRRRTAPSAPSAQAEARHAARPCGPPPTVPPAAPKTNLTITQFSPALARRRPAGVLAAVIA